MIHFILPLLLLCMSSMGVMIIADTTSTHSPDITHAGHAIVSNVNQSHMTPSTDNHPASNIRHHHGVLEVSSPDKIPTISMTVTEDSYFYGWNIHLKTPNFQFSPEHAGSKNVDNEGHAHLYIDGKKFARLYGPWNYVFDLSPGPHTFRVSLNSNDHSKLTYNGKPIEAVAHIVQK